MVAKYGFCSTDTQERYYTTSLEVLQPLIDHHPNWYMKRMDGHRWEVRNGVKDKTYYGQTLAIAVCKALVDL
jgi:hypothetical protein